MKKAIFSMLAAVVALIVCSPQTVFANQSQGPGHPSTIKVGTEQLRPCGGAHTYCGSMQVPLDRQITGGPTIKVCFRWYPAKDTSSPALGTVMPVEGGPGYPSIGSVEPDGYAAMYGPLLDHWNMLAVDLRGTGCSTLLNCPALQNYVGSSATSHFDQVVGKCADELNHRWKEPDGSYIHASDLFTSAPAAQDVAAVIEALGIHKVDLYGDSYGSWFAQVFASRFPGLVRSVILDSTYQINGLDPWYRSSLKTMEPAFNAACTRSVACADAQHGVPAWTTISDLAASLRAHPVSGVVPNAKGHLQTVHMGIEGLVNLVSDSAEDPYIYRTLDGAARSLLYDHVAAPLLRLYAQRLAIDEAYFGLPPSEYSVELYMAVSCLDYPQLYNMNSTPAQRPAELEAAIKAMPADTFAPFTTTEWLSMDQNTENFTACLDWPSPQIAQPPVTHGAPLFPHSMKVLILSGEFDSWTPYSGTAAVINQIGADTRLVWFANSTHVLGEADPYPCASGIIDKFVRYPYELDSINTTCAKQIPTVRAVGMFSDNLEQVPALQIRTGSPCPANDKSCETKLELVSAAIETAGDAFSRHFASEIKNDTGLYGGFVSAGGGTITLTNDELVPGVYVSGAITNAANSNELSAGLWVGTTGSPLVELRAWWPKWGGAGVAYAAFKLHGETVVASGNAP
ncbi:MAG: alpha/beta hydrolase [Acidimicrobiales bacterium]